MSAEPDRDEWVTRLRGDSDVRDAAIEELRGIILRGLSRSLNHRYGGCLQAEDVVQDALLKILDSLDRFEGRSRFTTWAMTVATRVGISELRRKHCQDVSLDSLKPEESMKIEVEDEEEASPEQRMDRKFLTQKLKNLISSELSDKQKIAVRALLEGMPVEEIASRTGSNRNAVYKLIHDARLKLRDGFEQAGIVADDVTTIFA
ncbi:sigma-70 family RNA polymerase sigma factor [Thalassoglobus sp. JC818]|uniref:RNA polymerase sigma factor n=1 Tax=Thalassoglobus sp. JC818 TaxID=3232136 RepID=UPI003458ADE0